MIIGSETWLSPGIYEREVLPCGYHIVARKDRKGSPHGDVLIATKDTINGTEIDMDTDTEFTAASFECPGKHTLIIGALYRPQMVRPSRRMPKKYAPMSETSTSHIQDLLSG